VINIIVEGNKIVSWELSEKGGLIAPTENQTLIEEVTFKGDYDLLIYSTFENGKVDQSEAESNKLEAISVFSSYSKRKDRNNLLSHLDSVVSNPLRFSSFSELEVQELKDYRQALLDYPQHEDFPNNDLPTKPEFL
jgi:hypothetical protein